MSRSYKKNPIIKDGRSGAVGKKFANKKVRRYRRLLSDGGCYKKVFPQWDIHDYISRETKSEFLRNFEATEKSKINAPSDCRYKLQDETLGKAINRWKKWYLRK